MDGQHQSSAQNQDNSVHPNVRAWLAAIIDSSDDAIISKTLDGVVTTWNKGAERIFGFTSEEMVGKPILMIIPENRRQEETMILSRLRKGERVDHFETIRRRKDGTQVEVSVTISPVRDNDGKIVGVSKIARDITFQQQIQRELKVAKESAEQSQKDAEAANNAKDHFLSVLSHELRTPLTPALGAISFLEKDLSLSESMREQISMVRRNIETEARLVDDLLDLTRIARSKLPLHFEIVDVHAVVRDVFTMFQKDFDAKALAVRSALRAGAHHVWADAGRFQQVIINLISNAVKFTPEEGSITVRSANDEGNLQIEVVDTGVGIEPEVMPRLFNAFEQGEQSVTRRFGGLGLGLSIVKSLMELHHGSVAVASTGKGQGSVFTIRMPATSAIERGPASSGGPPTPQLKNSHVLLVEDHSDTRRVMTKLLRSFGCTVEAASSVKEAVELANHKKFDLLICDFGLPDGTGSDVVRYIHQKHPIKAIAMTGFGQDEDLKRSKEAGFAIHLTKPVNIDALQHAIEDVVS